MGPNGCSGESSLRCRLQMSPSNRKISENPRFTVTTPDKIVRDLFGVDDQNKQGRLDLFAEWAINGAPSPMADPMLLDFWRAYQDRFRSLILDPTLSGYRNKVEEA